MTLNELPPKVFNPPVATLEDDIRGLLTPSSKAVFTGAAASLLYGSTAGSAGSCAANALLQHMRFPGCIHGTLTYVPYNLREHMRLDETALRALHVFPEDGTVSSTATSSGVASVSSSLFGLLNSAIKTRQGSRQLAQWLSQPLTDREVIEARLDVVEALMDSLAVRLAIRDVHFRGCPDLARLVRKLQRGAVSIQVQFLVTKDSLL